MGEVLSSIGLDLQITTVIHFGGARCFLNSHCRVKWYVMYRFLGRSLWNFVVASQDLGFGQNPSPCNS